jgi:hypothetical protein
MALRDNLARELIGIIFLRRSSFEFARPEAAGREHMLRFDYDCTALLYPLRPSIIAAPDARSLQR